MLFLTGIGLKDSWKFDAEGASIYNRAMMALDRSPESFSPQLNSTSYVPLVPLVTLRVGPVLTPKESYE